MEQHIMIANGTNFARDLWSPRDPPMLLNAWTQTTGEDFEFLRRLEPEPAMQAENQALRGKVSYLETKLKEHTELLSQIHATSARLQLVPANSPASPPTQQSQMLSPPNSVIVAPVFAQGQLPQQPQPQQQQHPQPQQKPQRAEVIDYKIISAAGDADAIEIRLAAESLNSLSTSADSDRLEICLAGDDSSRQVKAESSTPQPSQLIKRRKLETGHELKHMAKMAAPTPCPTPMPLQQQQQQQAQLQLQPLNGPYKLPTRRSNNSNSSVKVKQEEEVKSDSVMVSIGPNNTCVPATVFENINWAVSSLATRKLLVSIFDRETLATHSMTGKPSPAFKDQQKPLKQMLDPQKIQDIIFAVTHKSNASEKEVRNAITTKCADENKMMKIQKGKRCSLNDKENMARQ